MGTDCYCAVLKYKRGEQGRERKRGGRQTVSALLALVGWHHRGDKLSADQLHRDWLIMTLEELISP